MKVFEYLPYQMLFIALAKFKTTLSKDVVAQNMKDIEEDSKGQIRYLGIWWTLGKYDTGVMIEAPDEKAAIKVLLGLSAWTIKMCTSRYGWFP